MDDRMKSMSFFNHLGFSLLATLLFFLASCKYHVIEDYSFQNELEEDVELYLFVSNQDYNTKISPYHLIPKGDEVRLLTKETNDRGGFGGDYFHTLVDSAKVRIRGQEHYIAVWRQAGRYDLAEGYENLNDFYDYWSGRRQHAGSHAEYIYQLSIRD